MIRNAGVCQCSHTAAPANQHEPAALGFAPVIPQTPAFLSDWRTWAGLAVAALVLWAVLRPSAKQRRRRTLQRRRQAKQTAGQRYQRELSQIEERYA